ncbi:MAG: prolyl oligopeptidase family serine peptidase [Chloroflexota bacterium]
MRYVALLIMLLLSLSLIASTTAQSAPGVLDFDPATPRAPILAEEEVAHIAQLQATAQVFLLSPVSPDGQTVLALLGTTLTFLDVQNGTTVPLSDDFRGLSLISGLAGTYHWRDADTLTTLATIPPEQASDAPQVQRVTLDRSDGMVTTEPLPTTLAGMVIDVAPDLSHILVLLAPHTQQAPTTQTIPLASYQGASDPTNPLLPLAPQEREVTTQSANLVLLDTTTGDLRTLTTLPAGADIQGAAWNLTHSELAVTYTGVRDRLDDVQDLDGALLSSLVYQDASGALSPEDNPFFQHNELLLFNLLHDDVQSIRAADGAGGVFTGAGSWSPDGDTLLMEIHAPAMLAGRDHPVYLREESVSYRFYDRNLQEQGQISGTNWSPFATYGTFVTPTTVLFSAGIGTNIWLYTYDLTTETLQVVSEQPGTFGGTLETNAQLAGDGTNIVYTFHSFISSPEVYRSKLDGTDPQPLTQINAAVAEVNDTRMDAVSFPLDNGQTRDGWLLQPADAPFPPEDVPMVVWQEGGPGSVMTNRWGASVEAPFALLPNFDMAVLVIPLAGREGYGPAFFNTLYDDTNFGQVDIDELAAIGQQMVDDGWVAPGQLGISGCSYGGYVALQSIARHPEMYAAANPQCALIDLVVEWTRGYATTLPFLQGPATPYTHPQEYQDDSPSYNVDQMIAPVLTFHGTDDFLPITLNANLHQQLVDQEVPARMIRFIGEGHGLANPASQVYAAQEQLAWFRTYLVAQPDPGPGPGPDPNQFRIMLPLVGG